MQPRLDHVITVENLNVTSDGMKALVTLANGDMRKALNILQSTSMAHSEVNEDTVYTCTGNMTIKNPSVAVMFKWLGISTVKRLWPL